MSGHTVAKHITAKHIESDDAITEHIESDDDTVVKLTENFEKLIVSKTPKHSVVLDMTFNHTIKNISFGDLPTADVYEIFKDGRPFSHFIEKWLATNYPLVHVAGCKDHDFTDAKFPKVKYDEKTFTKHGCNFQSSCMQGAGRKFEKDTFDMKTKKIIFCIVSNVDFPNIKVRFVRGVDLLRMYHNGKISPKDTAFFE